MRWIQGYLYSLACTRSGAEPYSESKKDCNWQPQQYYQKVLYNGREEVMMPNNKIRQGRGLAGDAIQAESEEAWKEDGVSFGAGQLTIYNRSTIKKMLQPESKINYFSYKGNSR